MSDNIGTTITETITTTVGDPPLPPRGGERVGAPPECVEDVVDPMPSPSHEETKRPVRLSRSHHHRENEEPDYDADPLFCQFWDMYPRKQDRKAAFREWQKLGIESQEDSLYVALMAALATQRKSEGWTKCGGRYVPYAKRWLSGRRWEDVPAITEPVMMPDGQTVVPDAFGNIMSMF